MRMSPHVSTRRSLSTLTLTLTPEPPAEALSTEWSEATRERNPICSAPDFFMVFLSLRDRTRDRLLNLVIQELKEVIPRLLVVHHGELLERLVSELAVLLGLRDVDQCPRVPLDEERLDHRLAKLLVGLGAVDLPERGGGAGAHYSELLDRLFPELAVALRARELEDVVHVARDEEALDDLFLDLARPLGPVELPELGPGAHHAELMCRGPAQLGRLLGAGRLEHARAVARDHPRVEDLFLDVVVRGAPVDLV